MLKAVNLKYVLRYHNFTGIQQSQCHYSSNKGRKRKGDPPFIDDAPVEPVQLAFNSYENLTSDSSTSPILIMHGRSINSLHSIRIFFLFFRVIVFLSISI